MNSGSTEYTEVPTRVEFAELSEHLGEHCIMMDRLLAVVLDLSAKQNAMNEHYAMETILHNMESALFAAFVETIAEQENRTLRDLNFELCRRALEIVRKRDVVGGGTLSQRMIEANNLTIDALKERLKRFEEASK